MTDKQILIKAIKKAEKNGCSWQNIFDEKHKIIFEGLSNDKTHVIVYAENQPYRYTLHINAIIFNHDFAKAFWGDRKCIYSKSVGITPIPVESATQMESELYIYQYHLQQMVLEKKPLQYIKKFL